MNKISYKLGLLFFSIIILVEVILFYFLYSGLVDSRIEEELAALRARGESHRHVLEKSFDDMTIEHVALMESETETDVVIMAHEGEVLGKSTELTPPIQSLMQTERGNVPFEGMIVESRWETQSYIASVSPIIIDEQLVGHVYMFQDTSSIQNMISKLQHHFMLVGSLLVIFTIITVLFLSQAITQPLIRMKKATERLSNGDFTVNISHTSKDELGELANSIQTLANELNHLKKERNEFLASISHELRTPLTYVKGYADIARRKGINEEERNKYLHIIYEESEHISNLIKDLFELAKIDQHSFTIQKEKVNVCHFIKDLSNKVGPAFQKKRINLTLTCPTGLYANIDRSRFEQVMLNLLDNALKYTENESTVSLEVKANEATNKLTIAVADEGIGIPESELPLIFNRFHRVEKSRSRENGGTGLGLSIVKEIVEAHDGLVKIESKVGKGTTFVIELEQI